MCEEHTQLWPSFFYVQNTDISEHQLMCAEHKYFLLFFSVRRTQIFFTIIFCVQNTVNNGRHLQCAEHRQFSPSCCVCRTQTILTAMLCVENTDNFNGHVVCTEHRQFSPSCCVCRTQTNRTQTILTVMLCAQNTDNSHRHAVCAEHRQTEHRQTEHRQFSLSCVCRTQTEHRQFSPSYCVCRTQTNGTQTILTVVLCVQNTDKQNTDNSHCQFVRVEHSWAVVWTRPSAVPTTSCGNCSSRTKRGTSTVCDTAAYWSVGTDPSRLLWHQDGQTLTQWGTAHHTPTSDRSKRAKLLTSPSSFIALRCSLCLSFFFVLSVLSSSFLSSLFSLSCLLLCSLCLAFFLPVFLYSLSCLLLLCLLCSLCLVFFLPVSLFSLSCLSSCCLLCSRYLAFFLPMSVLAVLLSSFVSSFFSVPSCSVLKRNKLIGTVL